MGLGPGPAFWGQRPRFSPKPETLKPLNPEGLGLEGASRTMLKVRSGTWAWAFRVQGLGFGV